MTYRSMPPVRKHTRAQYFVYRPLISITSVRPFYPFVLLRKDLRTDCRILPLSQFRSKQRRPRWRFFIDYDASRKIREHVNNGSPSQAVNQSTNKSVNPRTRVDTVGMVVQLYIDRSDMIQKGERTHKSKRETRDKGPGATWPGHLFT